MMNTSKTILFFGTDRFSAPALEALIAAGAHVAAVVTKPDSRSGRGHAVHAPLVKTIAEAHNIPVWQPHTLGEIANDIRALGDATGVLSSYGAIIPKDIIELFKPGIINIHPSLLPLLRGPSPIETAIVQGDRVSGISLMLLNERMDAGPLYVQQEVSLGEQETASALTDRMATLGAELLMSSLDAIVTGKTTPSPQEEALATYSHLLTKEDGVVALDDLTATEIERRVRAFEVYPKTRVTLPQGTVIITASRVVACAAPKALTLTCKHETFLEIEELIAPSGKRMSGSAFLNGYVGR
jgi:methionyl-tRNA formyltransferase